MSATVIKKDERERKNRATMISDDLRTYLVERRRALLTELDALNRVLKTEPQVTTK